MPVLITRRFLLVLAGVIASCSVNPAHADPAQDWQRIAPVEAGFAPDLGEKLDAAVRAKEFTNLHGVVVARNGKLLLERYYAGTDQRLGRSVGRVAFGPEVKHDLRSISKSIVGLLYGIALADGKVPDLDQPLLDQFPAYRDLAGDPKRRRITVAHALTMTLGTEWDEDRPYTDARNNAIAMAMADDPIRYVLERPLLAEPGSGWTYNGGATTVLARLISQGTGLPLLDYAREKLFEPLGITDAEWGAAAWGLRLRPRDLAKIGQLVLDRGRWGGSQLVPADWLDRSFVPRTRATGDLDYGYHWWLGKSKTGQPWMAAFGNGGQRLYVVPGLQIVIVVTTGNYNIKGAWKLTAVVSKVIVPALRDE